MNHPITADMLIIDSLTTHFGNAVVPSPLQSSFSKQNFLNDATDRILADITLKQFGNYQSQNPARTIGEEIPSFALAGARDPIFWNPKKTNVAIVTCGGLAPGLNNVIQNCVTFLHDRYHVKNIYGVPYGYQGFSVNPQSQELVFQWIKLDPRIVQNIDFEAGSVLGTGRGHSNPSAIVDALVKHDIQILFTIGGDGTLSGAHAIYQEIKRRKLCISLIGIPKTIDNDVLWVSKTFGFESSVSKAVEALRCAQSEARSAYNGIGLVKIMGRNSGALTATAAAALNDIDFVLIPEISLVLEGKKGFLHALVNKVLKKGYITIAVAEGAGQNLIQGEEAKDASGNIKLKDIGRFLQQAISQELKERKISFTLKYIDPSYMLRAQATTADDSVFCANLSQNAVHAAMAGKTGCMIGYTHERFTHVPLSMVSKGKKHLDINDSLWLSVLAATGQPSSWESVSTPD